MDHPLSGTGMHRRLVSVSAPDHVGTGGGYNEPDNRRQTPAGRDIENNNRQARRHHDNRKHLSLQRDGAAIAPRDDRRFQMRVLEQPALKPIRRSGERQAAISRKPVVGRPGTTILTSPTAIYSQPNAIIR